MRYILLFIVMACSLLPICGLGQTPVPTKQKAQVLKRVIEKNHYAPRPVDDSFSAAVYQKILDELDPFKLYFTQNSLKPLEKYRYTIDDELNGKSWGFTQELTKAYTVALTQSTLLVKQILSTPMNAREKDWLDLSEHAPYPANEAAQQKKWEKYLKWRMLEKMAANWEEDGEGEEWPKDDSEWYKEQEKETRQQIGKYLEKRGEKWLDDKAGIEKRIEKLYLNTVAKSFDPHTQYFDTKDNSEFTEALSSQSLEYGFDVEEDDDGEYAVAGLVPGGAAWNTGNIYKDDKLVQIKTSNGKVLNVKDLSADELENLLSLQGKEAIELTLKSGDGKTKTVKLQKEEVENEENLVRGYVLEGEKKIGYIALPSFYTEWDEQAGSGCANDLSKEIIKLKREKIEGLIFDLRYNGGGSLQEAIEISGIFIEAGPMCIIKESDGKMHTLKDPSRGTIYDGPLVLLINGQSASASELVAGTLQDYKRAVVVGSASFGKATMQAVLPLDSNFNPLTQSPVSKSGNQKNAQSDFVKTTTGKLYRISGLTNQLNGVIPDVVLPDAFEVADYAESKLPNALLPDSIGLKVEYTPLVTKAKWQNPAEMQKSLLQQPYFAELQNWVNRQKAIQANFRIPLSWADYIMWQQQWTAPAEEDEKFQATKPVYKPANTTYTNRLLQLDSEYRRELNEALLEGITNDPFLDAAYRTILQLIF